MPRKELTPSRLEPRTRPPVTRTTGSMVPSNQPTPVRCRTPVATRGRRLRPRGRRQAAKGRKSEVCGGRAASRGREDRRFVRAAQRVPHPKDGNCAEWQRDNGANDGTATWAVPPHPPRSSPGKSSDAHQHARYPRANGTPPRVLRHRRIVGRVQLERTPRRRLPRHSEGARPIPVEGDNSLVLSPEGGGETHSCVASGAAALRSGRLGGARLLRPGGGRRPAAARAGTPTVRACGLPGDGCRRRPASLYPCRPRGRRPGRRHPAPARLLPAHWGAWLVSAAIMAAATVWGGAAPLLGPHSAEAAPQSSTV